MMHPSPVALANLCGSIDAERIVAAHEAVRAELLGERTVRGHWVGEVAGSPMATATAISALVVAHGSGSLEAISPDSPTIENLLQGGLSELIVEGLHWLAERQNDDGGWGDTEHGKSNIAATLVVQSAFRLTGVPAKYEDLIESSEEYVEAQGGVAALRKKHGRDKTLAAPILANAALAGIVPWRQVPALPFEYASWSQRWQSRMQLPVTSHAAAILAAVGLLKFHHDPPRNPLTRLWRVMSRKRALATLERLQPEHGGFFESSPLTAFVVMSLASMGLAQHRIAQRGVEFLLASVRSDASWPLVTNLATRNTALAIASLAEREIIEEKNRRHDAALDTVSTVDAWHDTAPASGSASHAALMAETSAPTDGQLLDENCVDWLLDCQHNHDLKDAGPGGWSWTDLPGGVPDAEDTAGALLALAHMRHRYPHLKQHRLQLAARRGIEWLLQHQNNDGGWPTFTRGWNTLPFDRSATDVTARALRALAAWEKAWRTDRSAAAASDDLHARISAAIEAGVAYLAAEQRNDGGFVPLWFGNQYHPEGRNLVYGTASVLIACQELGQTDGDMAQRAARWLLGVQHGNGGWGPPRTSPATSLSNVYRSGTSRAEDALASFCSVEETSLALEALLPLSETNQLYARAVKNGLKWLVEGVEQGRHKHAAPIGFYFAKLWYHERLYPLAFATSALREAVRHAAAQPASVVSVG